MPDLFVPSDFLLLNHAYDWWEDTVLLILYIVIVSFLIYSWRYFGAVLKHTPVMIYLSVAVLAVFQYMGENAIFFPETFGLMVEELTEGITYAIALVYLWNFNLANLAVHSTSKRSLEVAMRQPVTSQIVAALRSSQMKKYKRLMSAPISFMLLIIFY